MRFLGPQVDRPNADFGDKPTLAGTLCGRFLSNKTINSLIGVERPLTVAAGVFLGCPGVGNNVPDVNGDNEKG